MGSDAEFGVDKDIGSGVGIKVGTGVVVEGGVETKCTCVSFSTSSDTIPVAESETVTCVVFRGAGFSVETSERPFAPKMIPSQSTLQIVPAIHPVFLEIIPERYNLTIRNIGNAIRKRHSFRKKPMKENRFREEIRLAAILYFLSLVVHRA